MSDPDRLSPRAANRGPNAPGEAPAKTAYAGGPRFVWKFVAIALAFWAASAALLLITAGGGNTGHRPLPKPAPVRASMSFMNAMRAEQEPRTVGVSDERGDP